MILFHPYFLNLSFTASQNSLFVFVRNFSEEASATVVVAKIIQTNMKKLNEANIFILFAVMLPP
jgi:hypothetical protein